MKLRAGDLAARLDKAPGLLGLLVFGPDPVAVGMRRDEALARLVGPEAEADMRLTRLSAQALRDPAALSDALRARGFFPGPRAVLAEGLSDAHAGTVADALAEAQPGEDAVLVATAGVLPARSKLRKLFEGARNAAACQLFDDPPGRAEIAAMLREAGAEDPAREALEALEALGRDIDRGSLRQLCATVALHAGGSRATAADVAALAPETAEAGLDAAIAAAAEGRPDALGTQLARLDAQGVPATGLCIAASRHFRQLHAAACDPDGVEAGIDRLKPRPFGPRRAAMLSQIGRLGRPRIERALRLLIETDLALRSGGPAPDRAMIGAALIRIARARAAR